MNSQNEQLMEEKIRLEKELEGIDLVVSESDGICGTGLLSALEEIKKKRDRLQEINKQLGGHRDAPPNYQVVISFSADKEADQTIEIRKAGPVNINVLITNISNTQLSMPEGMDWYRPQLFHSGEQIPYKERMAEKIKMEDRSNVVFTASGSFFLDSHKPYKETIELSYWYDELSPGHYLLSVERIFFKQRIRSNVVEFDILP